MQPPLSTCPDIRTCDGGKPVVWGKTAPGPDGTTVYLSLFRHLLIVGLVARILIQSLPSRVRHLFPVGTPTLCALHDIGKAALGFLAKSPEWLNALDVSPETRKRIIASQSDHTLIGQSFMQRMLGKARGLAVAIGAHHGKIHRRIVADDVGEYMVSWGEAQRTQITDRICRALGALPNAIKVADEQLWLIAGLITVADWIGSNETNFSPDTKSGKAKLARRVRAVLKDMGIPGTPLLDISFDAVFGFAPNPLQRELLEAASGPGLYIIEAEPGGGKTEAALSLAHRLIVEGHHNGLYFALPTQVTSNRVHLRVRAFLERCAGGPELVRLAHGTSWLDENSTSLISPMSGETSFPDDRDIAAKSWFASAKRALLVRYGVGTVDQALMGVVAVKHFFVRLFGLAGKVVIFDEVHSYDIYTGSLLAMLIGRLRSLDCTVIVLSATLTAARRRELLAAVNATEAVGVTAYPLVSIVPDGSREPRYCTPPPPPSKKVSLSVRSFSDPEVVVKLTSSAAQGMNVLCLCNTVAEAQRMYELVKSAAPADAYPVGLLHSRFPLKRRQEIEEEWLTRLGKDRRFSGIGSVLVATQVVEQSLDIDFDFLVTDIAPLDLLLQRLGRLWRHTHARRAARAAEAWVRAPSIGAGLDAKELRKSLGHSAWVYSPCILLRSIQALQGKTEVIVPADVRPLLEAVYADPHPGDPMEWAPFFADEEAARSKMMSLAINATKVFGQPASVDDETAQTLTRRSGPPTRNLVILRSVDARPDGLIVLTAMDGTSAAVDPRAWRLNASRLLHAWAVRVPLVFIPGSVISPPWAAKQFGSPVTIACADARGALIADGEGLACCYFRDSGVVRATRQTASAPSRDYFDESYF